MDISILLEYSWVLLLLVFLEGLLSADNAVVLAVMVKHLPDRTRKKALLYGLAGAFFFRFASLFFISYLVNVWEFQAIGAVYLLFIGGKNIFTYIKNIEKKEHEKNVSQSGFWFTVLKVEIADLAFAIDSILAAVALAVSLPDLGNFYIGGLNGSKFIVIFIGGFIGLIIMRFAAMLFVKLLKRKPGLELAAFILVFWVGVKLLVLTLSHKAVAILPHNFPESFYWKLVFYIVLIGVAVAGWFLSKDVNTKYSKQMAQ